MKPIVTLGLFALLAAPACAQQTQSGTEAQPSAGVAARSTAQAQFTGRDGKALGNAALIETSQGVLVQLRLTGIPAGSHGFHVHQTGKCEPPAFQSAGGHFNPANAKHGFLNPQGPHGGDMPNVVAQPNGVLNADVLLTGVSLGSGANSLFPEGGTTLMIHVGQDDYSTDPAGNSGDRIACGVITRQGNP